MAQEQNRRTCDGQCQSCSLIQQTYCSAARLYALMEHEQVLFKRLEQIENTLSSLERKFKQDDIIIAQGGDGAGKRSPETETTNL